MAKIQKYGSDKPVKRRRPALSPEARENELISLAYDAVEERIRNGTATSQELCHFLKLGSQREKKEQEFLDLRKELAAAKTEAMKAAAKSDEAMSKALAAFKSYKGIEEEDDEY